MDVVPLDNVVRQSGVRIDGVFVGIETVCDCTVCGVDQNETRIGARSVPPDNRYPVVQVVVSDIPGCPIRQDGPYQNPIVGRLADRELVPARQESVDVGHRVEVAEPVSNYAVAVVRRGAVGLKSRCRPGVASVEIEDLEHGFRVPRQANITPSAGHRYQLFFVVIR